MMPNQNASPQMQTTSNDNFSQPELDKFNALANRWWDPEGPQKPLHALNPARLGYVRDRVPLQGARALDVGCGAGLLSEALAREGADVVAIDLAPDLIKVAKLHRLESGVKVDYRLSSVEALAADAPGSFDVVTCMEMLEHVPDPRSRWRSSVPSTSRACCRRARISTATSSSRRNSLRGCARPVSSWKT
jgi:2-polyprenyl-6-hydroxyphenyl methylase/3-demethylubiquinone-9 3-methyltransferase